MLHFYEVLLAIVNPARRLIRSRAKANNHAMHMGGFCHFAFPTEGAISEVEMHTVSEERFPKCTNTLALYNGIGRYQRGANGRTLHHLGRLFIPTADVVQIAYVLPAFTEDAEQIPLLLLTHPSRADKRRVTDDVIRGGADRAPVHTQSVLFGDMRLGAEWEVGQPLMEQASRRALRASLRNPHGRARHHDGEVVHLDPIEVINRDKDRRKVLPLEIRLRSIFRVGADDLILQPAEREVRFRKEITRPASRIEEGERGETPLEGLQLAAALLRIAQGFQIIKLVPQPIEEERINHAVDVLHRGIVHAPRAARHGVEGTLKHGTEDGRRDAAPVELLLLVDHHQRIDGIGAELGHLHAVVSKEPAVDIGQLRKAARVGVALFVRRIKHTEEAHQL